MPTLYANMHMLFMYDYLTLENLDFEQNVKYLKREIGDRLEFSAERLEIVFRGIPLNDDSKLRDHVHHDAVVHCFEKTPKFKSYVPPKDIDSAENIKRVVDVYTLLAHRSMRRNVRVLVAEKVSAEYPDFRRNLGALSIIRDSLLFNNLLYCSTTAVENLAAHYPIMCVAAPFIVDTVQKEIAASHAKIMKDRELGIDKSASSSGEEDPLGIFGRTNTNVRQVARGIWQDALREARRDTRRDANPRVHFQRRYSDAGPSSSLARLLPTDPQRELKMETSSTESTSTSSSYNGSEEMNIFYRGLEYAEQLRTMEEMGFANYEDNLMYLHLTRGNIENAIFLLIGAMN